nr:MAG TPA: KilA-N domain [Caudoviricetes sp.]
MYSLNDLHKASGGEPRHRPNYWLENKQTTELIAELEAEQAAAGNPVALENQVVRVINGNNGGTFVCKELVYAYAMWISPAFNLKVIRAFDAITNNKKLTPAETLLGMAQQLVDHERQIGTHTEEILLLQEKNRNLELRLKVYEQEEEYYTMKGYSVLHDLNYSAEDLAQLSKKVKQLSVEMGYKVSKAKDKTYGQVNAYHEKVLDAFFADEI